RELRPEMPSLHSHSDRALECCRQVAPVRPIDLRKGLSSPPLQVGVSGAEKLPVVTNDEGPSEVLSTEWATCRRGVWGGRQYAPHAFGYPCFSACTQRCHVGLHPSRGNGIERREVFPENPVDARDVQGGQAERFEQRGVPPGILLTSRS